MRPSLIHCAVIWLTSLAKIMLHRPLSRLGLPFQTRRDYAQSQWQESLEALVKNVYSFTV